MNRLIIVAALIAAASSAHAQSVPPITRSKQVAAKTADAASERVRAQTSVTDETPAATDAKAPAPGSKASATPERPAATTGRSTPGTARPTTGASRPTTTAERAATAGTAPAGRTPPDPRRAGRAAASASTPAVDSVRPEGAERTSELVLMREVYRYDEGARRDPFVSLMESGDLRPVAADLRLIGVIYDPTGRRSLATLRDVTTTELYRVAVGNVLGRTRITHIQPKQITMTIEEFGFSRQLVLILGDTTDTRTRR